MSDFERGHLECRPASVDELGLSTTTSWLASWDCWRGGLHQHMYTTARDGIDPIINAHWQAIGDRIRELCDEAVVAQ